MFRYSKNGKTIGMDQRAFTLIELLIVIAIIAILSVVVILTLNPSELLKQSRDSNRIADMATLNSALGFYAAQGGTSFGNVSTTYLSVPDPSATSTAGDQCQGLGLPALPTGDTYQCEASSSFRNTNGTGWIPINFSSLTAGSPLGTLPIDPTNQTSSNFYYTYTTNGSQYEVTSILESQKYKTQFGNAPQDPDYPEVLAQGSNLALSELYNPSGLVAYWALNEGSGTTAIDDSSNQNNGMWNGTQTGSSGYYSGGKVGTWAGNFDGSTDYVFLSAPSNFSASAITFSAWIYLTTNVTGSNFAGIISNYCSSSGGVLRLTTGNKVNLGGSGLTITGTAAITLNTWTLITGTINASSVATDYINGTFDASGTVSGSFLTSNSVCIGTDYTHNGTRNFTGQIDDARVYNRALSAAEVQALYDAEK